MFWSSVWQGLAVFSHWEVWVVVAAYTIAMVGITMTGGLLIAKERAALGMTWMLLLAPLLQILVTLVAIMSLAPILFSLGDSASWELPWIVMAERTWRTAKFVGAAVLVLVMLGAVGLGKLPGVTQFATGALATATTASLLAGISPNLRAADLELWPGFLVVIGFLVLAAILQFAVIALLSIVASMLKIDPEENEGAFMLMVMPVSAAVMFLPTFMYAAFLAPQLARF